MANMKMCLLVVLAVASVSALAEQQTSVVTNGTGLLLSDADRARRIRNGFLQKVAATSLPGDLSWRKGVFRELYQLVPDKIYLMPEQPFDERVRYYKSEEHKQMMERVCKDLEKKYPKRLVHDNPIALQMKRLSEEILLCGRPACTIDPIEQ